jgi:hypothetical protein
MDDFLVITQGMGLALACGVRPYLPALLAGAMASSETGLDFDRTDYAFLQDPIWLIALVAMLAAVVGYERRRPDAFNSGPLGAALAGISMGIGALLFAGSLADEGLASWPGIVAGIPLAGLAAATTRDLFGRVSQRLEDDDSRSALAVYKDGASLLIALLAIVAPPASILVLAGIGVLYLRGRGREGEKYAGLRILR